MRKALVAIFALIGLFSQSVCSRALYQPSVPDEIGVYILGKDIKTYYDLIKAVSNDKAVNIKEAFKKKKLDTIIRFKHRSRGELFAPAKARIMGDWKDHIDAEREISSLAIRLQNENIGNIVKFRILLPKTRQGDNEIFWSVLMEELGYPVPYRKNVRVHFNETITFDAIFEEATEKEFLERFGYRESPIVEADERQIWSNRIWMHIENRCLARSEDGKCKPPGDPHFLSYKVDNASFLKNPISNQIGLNALNITNTENNRRFEKSNRRDASHGLIRSNRKWIFDPIYGVHIPVYFDGDVYKFDKCKPSTMLEARDKIQQAAIARVRSEFFRRNGKHFSERMLCSAREYLRPEFYLVPESVSTSHPGDKLDLSSLDPLPYYPAIYPEVVTRFGAGEIRLCREFNTENHSLDNCERISSERIRRYLAGNAKPYTYNDYEVFPVVSPGTPPEVPRLKVITNISDDEILTVPRGNTWYLSLQEYNSRLTIHLTDASTSKIVFVNTHFGNNSDITITSEKFNDSFQPGSRYDERLLTSCVTFVDSVFDDSTISVSHGACEDSLNFIRSHGVIKEIKISNAASDALDADFSTITFKSLDIENAGNDCIDLSAGYYKLLHASITGCSDKGVSVGERARVVLVSASISDSDSAFVSKDSSRLHVHGFSLNRVNLCSRSYRKKQEFSGSEMLFSDQVKCKGKTDGRNSILRKSDRLCSHFFAVGPAEGCVADSEIILYHPEVVEHNRWHIRRNDHSVYDSSSIKGTSLCEHRFCETRFDMQKSKGLHTIERISRDGLILDSTTVMPGTRTE